MISIYLSHLFCSFSSQFSSVDGHEGRLVEFASSRVCFFLRFFCFFEESRLRVIIFRNFSTSRRSLKDCCESANLNRFEVRGWSVVQIVPDFTGFRRSVYWLDFRSEPCVMKVCKDLGDHSDFFKTGRNSRRRPTSGRAARRGRSCRLSCSVARGNRNECGGGLRAPSLKSFEEFSDISKKRHREA